MAVNPEPASAVRQAVVITGMGLITPIGIGLDATWASLMAGRSGVGPISRFDASSFKVRIASEVPDFDPHDWMEAREARRPGVLFSSGNHVHPLAALALRGVKQPPKLVMRASNDMVHPRKRGWEALVRVNEIPHYILPGPLLIGRTLVEDWPTLSVSLWVTPI